MPIRFSLRHYVLFIMDITPAPSNSSMERDGVQKVFGGKLADLVPGRVVKHNMHDQAVLMNAFSSCARARLDYLEVFAVPCATVEHYTANVYLGWGHSEHSMPSDLDQLAQLPCFTVTNFGTGDKSGVADRALVCEFDNSIVRQLKPVALEGGRPALYAMARAVDGDGGNYGRPVAELFFRCRLTTSGFDIKFS